MTTSERILTLFFGVVLIAVSIFVLNFLLGPINNIYQGLDTKNNLLTFGLLFYGLQTIVGITLLILGLFFSKARRKYAKIVWVVGGIFGLLMIPAFYFFVIKNIYSMLGAF